MYYRKIKSFRIPTTKLFLGKKKSHEMQRCKFRNGIFNFPFAHMEIQNKIQPISGLLGKLLSVSRDISQFFGGSTPTPLRISFPDNPPRPLL